MIYIDPPYNTGNDSFIYPDKFSETREAYARRVGDKDHNGYLKKDGVFQGAWRKNSKESGHFHSNWLSMMLPRLHLAKTLLREDGVIFISIDDNEQAQLKLLCDEVFGAENFVGELIQLKGNAQNDAINIQKNHEYILCYTKYFSETPIISKQTSKEVDIFKDKDGFYYLGSGLVTGGDGGTLNKRPNLGYTVYFNPKNQDFIAVDDYDKNLAKTSNDENIIYKDNKELINQGYVKIRPPKKGDILGCWTWALEKFNSEKNRIAITQTRNGFSLLKKERVSPDLVTKKQDKLVALIEKESNLRSILEFGTSQGTTIVNDLIGKKMFNNPKNSEMLSELISVSTNPNDLIMDFFSGSGTTAHAVMQLNAEDGGNRRFICVQLPEETDPKSEAAKAGFATIADIAKERIRRAGKQISENLKGGQTVDTGFKVFKLHKSHFRQWQNPATRDEAGLTEQLEIFQNIVDENVPAGHLACELALRLGFQLTDPMVFSDGIVWLDNAAGTRKTALLLKHFNENLLNRCLAASPETVFVLDRIFGGDDAAKTNAALQCQDAGVRFETL
ncbi:site-specific DNA-methyltransferase [Neisseria leonii]